MLATTFTAMSAGSLLWALLATTPAVTSQLQFAGFSADESLAAWQISVRRAEPAGRYVDLFDLIRVVDTTTNAVVETYRGAQIVRVDSAGNRRALPAAFLGAANPGWRDALPHAQWLATEQSRGFGAAPAMPCGDLVEIMASRGPAPRARASHGRVWVEGRPGAQLAYAVALADGQIVARYQHDGQGGRRVKAQLRVACSASGRRVALANRFELDGEGASSLPETARVATLRPHRQAIAAGRSPHPYATPASLVGAETELARLYAAGNLMLADSLSQAADLLPY